MLNWIDQTVKFVLGGRALFTYTLKLTGAISSLYNQLKSLITQCDITIEDSTCSNTIVHSGESMCWEKLFLTKEDWVESNDFNPEYDSDPY